MIAAVHDRDLVTLEGIIRARSGFGHREHLELAWTYLQRYPRETAESAVAAAIRHVAVQHGEPARYHETVTRAWFRLVAIHATQSGATTFEDFIRENRGLLDRHLLDRHYSTHLLDSDDARTGWTSPDLRALPAS